MLTSRFRSPSSTAKCANSCSGGCWPGVLMAGYSSGSCRQGMHSKNSRKPGGAFMREETASAAPATACSSNTAASAARTLTHLLRGGCQLQHGASTTWRACKAEHSSKLVTVGDVQSPSVGAGDSVGEIIARGSRQSQVPTAVCAAGNFLRSRCTTRPRTLLEQAACSTAHVTTSCSPSCTRCCQALTLHLSASSSCSGSSQCGSITFSAAGSSSYSTPSVSSLTRLSSLSM